MEEAAAAAGSDVHDLSLADQEALWQAAKERENTR
jgi:uncharacterized protein YabN with tetrapyrrole methylase and pyrophosphatase domain